MRPLTLIKQAWFMCMGMNIKANCPQDLFLFFLCGLVIYSTPFVFFHDGAQTSFAVVSYPKFFTTTTLTGRTFIYNQ
jgi:hypothetical protein